MPTVLHIVDRLTGGVPVAVRNYLQHSPSHFSHVILSPFEGGAPPSMWDGLNPRHADLTMRRARQPGRILSTIREFAPDVIHAHSSFPGALMRIVGTGKTPLVYSPHCFKFDDLSISSPLRLMYRLTERALTLRKARFAVLSAHEAELARSLARRADTVRIPNVPTFDVRASSREVRQSIGMTGRIAPQKDPRFMAELTRAVRVQKAAVEAVWIGGGDPGLEAELNAAGVRSTGWQTGPNVREELDALGVYVHTAAYEGFPLSVLDAAARRVPIVARRIPALDEVGIHTFDTPAEGADLAVRAIDDAAFRAELVAAGDDLLTRMNPDTQRAALDRLWGGA